MHLLSYPPAWYPAVVMSTKGNRDLSYWKCSVFVFVVSCPVINMKSLLSVLGFQGREGGCYNVSLMYFNYEIPPVGQGHLCWLNIFCWVASPAAAVISRIEFFRGQPKQCYSGSRWNTAKPHTYRSSGVVPGPGSANQERKRTKNHASWMVWLAKGPKAAEITQDDLVPSSSS